MRLLIVTDAWSPQTNGVVTTLANVIGELEADGHEVHVIEPGGFRMLPLPGYAEIRIVREPWRVGERIEESSPRPLPSTTAPGGSGSSTTTQVMSASASISRRTWAMSPRDHLRACFASTACRLRTIR